MKPKNISNREVAPPAVSPKDIRFAIIATDIVCFRIINSKLSVLLGKISVKGNPFEGCWSLIGGLVHPRENADEAAMRLLVEKAGISKVYKEQLYTFSEVDRDPRGRVVSVAYLALASHDPQDLPEYQLETKWVAVNDLPKLAYDHNVIAEAALERLQSKIRYTTLAQYLLPQEFTLSELQNIYEVVVEQGIDKRNFRKKILAAEIIKDTGRTRKQGVMRPAVLYTFISKKPNIVEIF